jgi:hypothetical protein
VYIPDIDHPGCLLYVTTHLPKIAQLASAAWAIEVSFELRLPAR